MAILSFLYGLWQRFSFSLFLCFYFFLYRRKQTWQIVNCDKKMKMKQKKKRKKNCTKSTRINIFPTIYSDCLFRFHLSSCDPFKLLATIWTTIAGRLVAKTKVTFICIETNMRHEEPMLSFCLKGEKGKIQRMAEKMCGNRKMANGENGSNERSRERCDWNSRTEQSVVATKLESTNVNQFAKNHSKRSLRDSDSHRSVFFLPYRRLTKWKQIDININERMWPSEKSIDDENAEKERSVNE